MTKKYLILMILCFGLKNQVLCQQDPQFSQYIFNQQFYNPATVNSENQPVVKLLHRSQYTGYVSNFDEGGGLNTQLLSVQIPLAKIRSGLGLVIINDQAGLEKNQQIKFSLARDIKIAKGALSIGISAGFYNKSYNDNFRPRETGDPNIPTGGISQIKPDFGIGVSYSNKYVFGGLGINHINKPSFDFTVSSGNNLIDRNLNGIFGIQLNLNEKITVKPNILIRSDFQTSNFEGGLLFEFKNKYWLGTNYRKEDAVILMAGTSLLSNNALKVGAAYDFVVDKTAIKSNSSFELMASYLIGKTKNNKQKNPPKVPVIRTPRYRF